MTPADLRLVADIGGTNTRIALYDESTDNFLHRSDYINADFQQLSDLLSVWSTSLDGLHATKACIAIAAPMTGDKIAMVNCSWSFRRQDIARQLGVESVTWLNDFESNAYALPYLLHPALSCLQNANSEPGPVLATVGPGTGLGGATLDRRQTPFQVRSGEPGHMGLSPGNASELAVFTLLLQRFDNIYGELLLSGPGLVRLYRALCESQEVAPTAETPEQISSAALNGEDPLCREAAMMFCNLLGSACGDFVLANGAYGGLYIAGGIVPKILPLVQESGFLGRFRQKGAMEKHLAQVPVYAITGADTGLLGAAHATL